MGTKLVESPEIVVPARHEWYDDRNRGGAAFGSDLWARSVVRV